MTNQDEPGGYGSSPRDGWRPGAYGAAPSGNEDEPNGYGMPSQGHGRGTTRPWNQPPVSGAPLWEGTPAPRRPPEDEPGGLPLWRPDSPPPPGDTPGIPPGAPPGIPPGGPPVGPPPVRRRRRWLKRVLIGVLVLIVLLAGSGTWLYFHAQSKLHHEAVFTDYPGRPAQGGGENWLIVGSDSRDGLSHEEENKLHVGSDAGQRTDSMMLLHHGSDGTVLLSLPRDSYVQIPAWTSAAGTRHAASHNKLNAAYSFGGAPLLVQTIEMATGIRIDHYAEVGFGGFVRIVDTVGGVDMCLPSAIKDDKSGANLAAGCQTLNGQQALAYVRARYFDPLGDIGRMNRQRQFLSALAHKVSSMGVILNPFKSVPVLDESMDAFTVDNGTGLMDVYDLFNQMKSVNGGGGKTMVVPISNPSYNAGPSVGLAVLWDKDKSQQLFTAIEQDKTLPNFPAT